MLLPTVTRLVQTPDQLRGALRRLPTAAPGGVGLVPTMGALHSGHAQLIRRARAENAGVVLSLFVNPLQFGPSEDFERYPRDLEADLALAGAEGVDLVFAPSTAQMYPPGFATRVKVQGVSEGFDGAARPGHFDGVATVVLKLLNLVRPDRAYFGEKDWQQLAVVRRMVRDLDVPSKVVGVPTVRSAVSGEVGLALSSRNTYFTPEQRRRAGVLFRALGAAQAAYALGERRAAALLAAAHAVLETEPDLSLEYLSLVDGDMHEVAGRLPERDTADRAGVNNEAVESGSVSEPRLAEVRLAEYRLLVAARLFGVRLIDNLPLISGSSAPVEGGA